jgi:DNA ligase-1
MTVTYPDALDYIKSNVQESCKNFIFDCEIVPYDIEKDKILPFQILTTRSKKNVEIEDVKIQVCLFVFDLLYFNGESLIKKTLEERRNYLHQNFIEEKG